MLAEQIYRAQQLLAGSSAPTRHIILLSDGITASPVSRSASTAEEVQAMLLEGATPAGIAPAREASTVAR